LGLEIPDDISLLSIDNYDSFTVLPVSTVDIGADTLGYRAFHAILGDIPYRRRGGRSIIGEPRVVRRGSVRSLVER
jgi:DNA-binding LacI/PurR family transcriptional regulator